MGVKVAIEHLEPKLGAWLLCEYENASKILGKDSILFANMKDARERSKLRRLGEVRRESVLEIFPCERLLILDPRALKRLKPMDIKDRVIVIGGILGDHPPRGRTERLLTDFAPDAIARNIGKWQFTIDGSAHVAKEVAKGKELDEVPIQRGLVIRRRLRPSGWHEIRLPYAYPVVGGVPLISKRLVEYLTRRTS